ncbi:hypothetical protein L484_005035 [Morus notabilis]|uniref:Uncharacterized protein n=1 Tax=Morus notabilis TaxID=981085 RepID=W9RPC5_9ROSA|nr:hypothetical protein L484_005035 [Morus notabilis]
MHGPALCRAVPGTAQALNGAGVKRDVPARHGTFDTTRAYNFADLKVLILVTETLTLIRLKYFLAVPVSRSAMFCFTF